ncbi:MAG TPA: serine hydrolase domain-containing protein, partial [Phycisphaerales bacterium]|nr:serine hydrolase domain-containing protein [Phycisphaerales bacterium]
MIHRTFAVFFVGLASAIMVCATATAQSVPEAASQPASRPDNPRVDLQTRLSRIAQLIEQQRQDLHIPGLALAIVQDDKVVFAKGFGVRDVENKLPADENTLFAVGSTTKAFTAMLIAMLVDEGKMSWDDPVRKFLPDFHLKDPDADANVTIRDLLCHRTGLAGADLLWIGGKTTRDEVISGLERAEPTAKFREACQYNNIGILIAGECAARAAGTD